MTRNKRFFHALVSVLLSLLSALPCSQGFAISNDSRFVGKSKREMDSCNRSCASTKLSARLGLVPRQKKVELALQSNNYLRGKLLVVVSKFVRPPAVYWEATRRILANTYWPELILVAVTANAIPIAQWLFLQKERRNSKESQLERAIHLESQYQINTAASLLPASAASQEEELREEETGQILESFLASPSRKVALVLRQIGLLQAALYLSDVCLVFLKLLDFAFVAKYQAQQVAGSIIFSTWVAYNLSQIKRYYLQNGIPSWSVANLRRRRRKTQTPQATNKGRKASTDSSMGVYNRFANQVLDAIIYLCACLAVVDMLGIHIGFALKSIFGLGSFGTLVLSLASKDVAAEFVGGLMLQSSNFIDEGESVVLQDGTAGAILKIGWLHTYIRKEDGFIVRVPNSQISHQRIAREQRTAHATTTASNGRFTKRRRYL